MYKDGAHPIFTYTEEEKQEVRKELGLSETSIQEDIDAIIEWFEKQPHLIDAGTPDRDFIERVLVNAKGSREKAKHRIDCFYKYKALAPELVQDRDKHLDSNHGMWGFYRHAAIPKLCELKRVSVVDFTDPDPNNFSMDVLLRNCIMIGDLRQRYEYSIGDIWVVDLNNTGLSHILRVNPLSLHKAAQIFQEGIGSRVCAIHVLRAHHFAQQLLNFFKRFLKPKIMDRVTFHESVEDIYKYLPKKYLPEDFGGEQPSMDDFKERYIKLLRSEDTREELRKCSNQISDESKRPGANIHDTYLAGSFKKLDFD